MVKTDAGNVTVAADQLLSTIVDRLVNTYHPERIYLFGSMARGDAGTDSDYDILLVVSDNAPSELLDAGRAHEALWGLQTSADVHVWSRNRFDSRLHLKASLPSTVVREGMLLYAA